MWFSVQAKFEIWFLKITAVDIHDEEPHFFVLQAYVTCTIGEEYIGYCMIILGVANVVSAILVAVCANIVPREVVFGIGGILHMGVMIGLLIWMPDQKQLLIFFIMSASWGVCDAVWQTQCNSMFLISFL